MDNHLSEGLKALIDQISLLNDRDLVETFLYTLDQVIDHGVLPQAVTDLDPLTCGELRRRLIDAGARDVCACGAATRGDTAVPEP